MRITELIIFLLITNADMWVNSIAPKQVGGSRTMVVMERVSWQPLAAFHIHQR